MPSRNKGVLTDSVVRAGFAHHATIAPRTGWGSWSGMSKRSQQAGEVADPIGIFAVMQGLKKAMFDGLGRSTMPAWHSLMAA